MSGRQTETDREEEEGDKGEGSFIYNSETTTPETTGAFYFYISYVIVFLKGLHTTLNRW